MTARVFTAQSRRARGPRRASGSAGRRLAAAATSVTTLVGPVLLLNVVSATSASATDNVTATIPVGAEPLRVAVDPATDMIYVVNSLSNTVPVITSSATTLSEPVFTVTNTTDSGPGSLRTAIFAANGTSGPDEIVFAIPASDPRCSASAGVCTISPLSPLPALTGGTTTIGGSTESAFLGTGANPSGPAIEINGSDAGPANGLTLGSSGNTINDLDIVGFQVCGSPDSPTYCGGGNGVQLTAAGNAVTGSYIGISPTGTVAVPNQATGVAVNAQEIRIGGTTPSQRNVISGNRYSGVHFAPNVRETLVEGNYIGTNARAAAAVPNAPGAPCPQVPTSGIFLKGNDNTISDNVVSGNACGIFDPTPTVTGDVIQGNYVGTDATGTFAIPNAGPGVDIGGSGNMIGGPTASDRNVISGNSVGVTLPGPTNTVEGDYIGTNANGTAPIPNMHLGVRVVGSGNTIGGPTAADRNVISGNQDGVTLSGTSNTVEGNFIGTNASGTAPIPNTGAGPGVSIGGTDNTVGGPIAADRNVISGNDTAGVYVGGSSSTVEGNYIGTNAGGTAALPNGFGAGVSGADNSIATNVISGNKINALSVSGSSNTVQGNYIGTNAGGTAAIPNTQGGIYVSGTGNTIGGPTAADRNVISGNGGTGVGLGGPSNRVEGNYIGTNAGGTAAVPNGMGVGVNGPTASDNLIADDVISGNDHTGVHLGSSSNTVEGDHIGTNAGGTAAIPNTVGVEVTVGQTGNMIGGPTPADRNVISGNRGSQVSLTGPSNTVEGDYIGTNAGGTAAIPNPTPMATDHGIDVGARLMFENLRGATGNVIGGSAPGDRNVISGNLGIGIALASSGNVVRGNFIGTDRTGSIPIGNGGGVLIYSALGSTAAQDNVIGGATAADRNVISGNNTGVFVNGRSNLIEGNYVGTDVSGMHPIGNSHSGIDINAQPVHCQTGKCNPTAQTASQNVVVDNLVSANGGEGGGAGIIVADFQASSPTADHNTIQGNLVGFDANGELVSGMGNIGPGVEVRNGTGNLIGGQGPGEGNVIEGNGGPGVLLGASAVGGAHGTVTQDNVVSGNGGPGLWTVGGSTGSVVEGNFIGTNSAGTLIPNAGPGVDIGGTQGVEAQANDNTIGGSNTGAANVIAYNDGAGVQVISGTGNRISRNSIFSNGKLGIALGTATHVTTPTCCGHTGPNDFENFPVLGSAKLIGNGLRP